MSHRKGFPRIVKTVQPFTPDHAVAGSIARGSRWFEAWTAQMTTPYAIITKKTGISADRLILFSRGHLPDAAEIEALAALWLVSSEGLLASIGQCRDLRSAGGSVSGWTSCAGAKAGQADSDGRRRSGAPIS